MKYALPLALTLAILLVSIPAACAQRKKEDPLADKVRKSIKEGVKYLRDQSKDGGWETDISAKAFPGGWTSLAVLALLNAGVPVEDPVVKKGLETLRNIEPTKTYTVSLQTMAFAQPGQNEDKQRIQRNVQWLLDARTKDGWTYNKELTSGEVPDGSNTQYALLALHEGRRAGAVIDPKVMKEIEDMYVRQQNKQTNSWEYSKAIPGGRFTMTTAGVCGLLITGMNLETEHSTLKPHRSDKDCAKY